MKDKAGTRHYHSASSSTRVRSGIFLGECAGETVCDDLRGECAGEYDDFHGECIGDVVCDDFRGECAGDDVTGEGYSSYGTDGVADRWLSRAGATLRIEYLVSGAR